MPHSAGDTQLVMSLVLVVVGTGLFLSGLGSKHWVLDKGHNHTVHYGLWETCDESSSKSAGCSGILPGSAKAYFEATRTIECLALVVYAAALCTCFIADDRDPSESCTVCLLRYIHPVIVFAAVGLTLLAILVFAGSYADDDWFKQPKLDYSYWLTLAGCIVTAAGGVMRIVFIAWPDRPTLSAPGQKRDVAPQAPQKRRARMRVDDELGADPLPQPLRPKGKTQEESEVTATKKLSGIKRFFAVFYRSKKKSAVADISYVSEALRHKQCRESGINQDESDSVDHQKNGADDSKIHSNGNRALGESWEETDETSDTENVHRRKRRHGGRSLPPKFYRNRRRVVEPFVGYNIPPTPGPDIPDIEDSSQDSQDEEEATDSHQRGVKRYQRVVEADHLRARVVSTPPPVVYPSPAPGREEALQYLTAKALMERRQNKYLV